MADVLISQVFTGALKATSYTGGSITLDPQNEIVYTEGANINQLQVRTIEPKGPFLDVLVDTDLVFNEFAVKWSNGANQSAIYQNGANLVIEATGQVQIPNLDLSNVNVNVNLDPIYNSLNDLSNSVNDLNSNVNILQNDYSNVSILANSAYNQANDAYNQANTALSSVGNAFNQANNAYNQANNAYNQANSATILAGSAYNQANSYLNSLNTNQLIVSSSELFFGVNMATAPQVFFSSNGTQGPVLRMYQQNGGDEKETYIGTGDLTLTHNYTSVIDPETLPFITFVEPANSVGISLHAGSVVPNFFTTPGSLYLQTTGDFYTYDGTVWTSQSLGSQVNTKHITVKDNPNSATQIELDPANLSGIYIQTNGTLEDPTLTVDKFNSSSDGIGVLSHLDMRMTHAFTTEDQTIPYVQLYDSASTALINANIYFGANVPTHTSLVGNGSLFIQGGATPNLYQFNGTAWAGVGGGGGGSTVAQRVISVGISTAQALPNTARTIVNFDATESNSGDTGAYFIWNGAGSRFEVINSGIYWVGAGLAVDYSATVPASQLSTMWVTINGSAVRAIDDFAISNGAPDPMILKAGRYLNLNAGAYLQVEVSQNFSGGSTINGDSTFLDLSYFEMARVV